MKLLVSDFDSTYNIDDLSIEKNNQEIKKFRKNGNLFMLSSGRSFNSLKKMCLKYKIEYDYLSCADGSILYDKDDNIIIKYLLDNDILEEFLNLKKLVDYDSIHFAYLDDYYPNYLNNELIGVNLLVKEELVSKDFLKSLDIFEEKYLNYSTDGMTFICLKNKDINKSTTIKYLQNKYKIDRKMIYTVGDNINDYEMLKYFNGYYIGNNQELKKICLKGCNFVFEVLNEIEKSDF